jgi:serpin B
VAERTHDKIDTLLPKGGLDARTRLVLVNAIYFHGEWFHTFKAGSTQPHPFHVPGKVVNVPTMRNIASFGHVKVGDVEAVEMAYAGNRFAITLAMPTKVDNFESFEAGLDSAAWDQVVSGLKHERLAVSVPRFKIDPGVSIELKKALSALGMSVAFDAKRADFRGMGSPANPDELLNIDEVYHQAVVEVDEQGTEAVAATGVVMKDRSARAPPRELRIERPFFFAIRELETGSILFMGRVVDPS